MKTTLSLIDVIDYNKYHFLWSQRHAKTRDEDNFWILNSYDQVCSGDEGSVSENETEIPVDLGQLHVTAQLAGKNSRAILVLCDKIPRRRWMLVVTRLS